MGDDSELIETVYAAALEPSLWPEVLGEVRAHLGISAINLILVDHTAGRPPLMLESGHDPAAVASWHLRAAEDPNLQACIRHTNRLVWSERIMPAPAYARNAFVNEVLVPSGLYHVIGFLLGGQETSFGVGIHRPRRRPFDASEGDHLSTLVRHLSRAMQVQRRLRLADDEGRSLRELLDRLRAAVVVVDDRGRIGFANATARAMEQAHDGLRLGRELAAASPSDSRRLRIAVTKVALSGGSQALSLERPSGRAPYRVLVVPVRRADAAVSLLDARARAAALVLVTDPEPPLEVDPAVLAAQLELSPMEARVTSAMLAGLSTADIADRLNIAVGTVRVHLRHILAKTHATNRAELLARLAAGLPSVLLSTSTR